MSRVYLVWTLDHMESGQPFLHGIYSALENARKRLNAMAEVDAEFNEDSAIVWDGTDNYRVVSDPDDARSTLEETYIEPEDMDKEV